MADVSPIEELEAIPGEAFLALYAVLPVVARHQLRADDYRFTVVDDPAGRTAVIEPSGRAAGRRGYAVRKAAEVAVPPLADRAVVGAIRGESLGVIQAAVGVFLKKEPQPDLAHYTIRVLRDGPATVVTFRDGTVKPAGRGAAGRPGFEVEFDAAAAVVKSYYIR